MAKKLFTKSSFTAGALGLSARGRVDSAEYQSGAAELTNALTTPQGPAIRRGGSKFLTDTGAVNTLTTKTQRLIEFDFDIDTGFMLLFRDSNIDIYNKNTDELVQTIASPYLLSDLPNLQYANFGNFLYLVDGRNAPQTLTRQSDTSFTIVDTSFDVPPPDRDWETRRSYCLY